VRLDMRIMGATRARCWVAHSGLVGYEEGGQYRVRSGRPYEFLLLDEGGEGHRGVQSVAAVLR